MNTGQLVVRVLDPGWLSEQAERPARAVRLRIKPRASLVVDFDDTAGHPAGWLRILWPISHNKAARTRREADELGLETTERELRELLAQTGPLPADSKPLKRIVAATTSGKLGRWEVSQVLRYGPLRGVVVRDGMRVVRVMTSRDREVASDRFIAGMVETSLRPDDGILDGASVHALTGTQDLAGLFAGNSPSRPSDENRLSWVASDSDGSWLSRAVSDSDGSWLSRAVGEANGLHRNHLAVDRDPTQGTPDPIRAAGAVLARLHTARAPDDPVRSLALRVPDPIAQDLAHAALLDELAPGPAEWMCRVVAWFPGATPAIPVLSHGDPSPDQVLTTRTGNQVWLTDSDHACLAPHAVDLGSFTAVLDDNVSLDGYRNGGGQPPPGDQL